MSDAEEWRNLVRSNKWPRAEPMRQVVQGQRSINSLGGKTVGLTAKLLLFASVLLVLGCSSSEPAMPEASPVDPAAANATTRIAADETADAAAEPEPQPVTIGPYTWAPGEHPGDASSVAPKHVKCWAALKATPSPDFPNPSDSLRGPVNVAYLRELKAAGHKLLHDDWTGRVVAVTAGPTARVTVYPKEYFGGESRTIEPGETLHLRDAPLDQVASLKIEYVP